MNMVKSHLVSRVVLKNFSDEDKRIRVYDLDKKDFLNESKRIKDVGFLSLPEHLFSEEEKKWNKNIESKYGKLLQKYNGDIGELYKDESNHGVLKKLIALHFVRSLFFF